MKRVYIIGICGVLTSAIAVSLKKNGFYVTGSDKGIYPPVSEYLLKNKIEIKLGYKVEHIDLDYDFVIVAAAVLPDNPELVKFQYLKVKIYMGFGEFLQEYYSKDMQVVVTGTYGKTTITGFITYILMCDKLNPSYAIGGLPLNFEDSAKLTNSDWSVFEGDEYINSRIDYKPRFLFYTPLFLVVNAAAFDHLDVYKSENDYLNAFNNVIDTLKKDGVLIVNLNGENIIEVLSKINKESFKNKNLKLVIVDFGKSENTNEDTVTALGMNVDVWIKLRDVVELDSGNAQFEIIAKKQGQELNTGSFQTKLIGIHNIENLVMGIAFGISAGIDIETLKYATVEYIGIKRRLEIRRTSPFFVIDDLAHSPIKAEAAINAVKKRFGSKRIIAIFEPHALSSRMKSSLSSFTNALGVLLKSVTNDSEINILIAPVYHPLSVSAKERIDSGKIADAIGANAISFNDYSSLLSYLKQNVKHDDVILCMTSGYLGGIIEKLSEGNLTD